METNILIVRNLPQVLDINSYNSQEIGLGRSFVDKGFNCDIAYYTESKKVSVQTLYKNQDNMLRILKVPGINVFNNGIYPKLLKKNVIEKYEVIITTEYSQIMSYLLSRFKKKKVVLYHGPYQDNRRKNLQIVYDKLFLKTLNKNIEYILSKSSLSTKYLTKKGFKKVYTLGVGLDTEKFSGNLPSKKAVPIELKRIFEDIREKPTLLYIGRLEDRRNIIFLLDLLSVLVKEEKDIRLLLVGNGSEKKVESYFNYAKEIGVYDFIFHIEKVEQSFIPLVYQNSDIFLFPSKYDIFGMVLLESMYHGIPVISSINGGSKTLIEHGQNGFVIEDFHVLSWRENILSLLNNKLKYNQISTNSRTTIINEFTWDKITDKIISYLNLKS